MRERISNVLTDESKEGHAGKDKTLVIKSDRCPQNHACRAMKVCPVKALTQNGLLVPTVDLNTCISCGKCVKSCKKGALVLE